MILFSLIQHYYLGIIMIYFLTSLLMIRSLGLLCLANYYQVTIQILSIIFKAFIIFVLFFFFFFFKPYNLNKVHKSPTQEQLNSNWSMQCNTEIGFFRVTKTYLCKEAKINKMQNK